MLAPLLLGRVKLPRASTHVPPLVRPLLDAAARGEDVAPIALSIARSFGFDGFLYAATLNLRPNTETQQFFYCTWPAELMRLYDERAYVEIDPRIQDLVESVVPLVWDQSTYRGRSAAVDEFLDVIQEAGVASGMMCPLRDMAGRMALLSLSSAIPICDEVRHAMITREMGDVMLFTLYFHELFVSGVLNEMVPPHLRGVRLSGRERQCITHASRGNSSEDIAMKLNISPRTVQAHFDSIRSKLGAANRQEAIAIALKTGMINR